MRTPPRARGLLTSRAGAHWNPGRPIKDFVGGRGKSLAGQPRVAKTSTDGLPGPAQHRIMGPLCNVEPFQRTPAWPPALRIRLVHSPHAPGLRPPYGLGQKFFLSTRQHPSGAGLQAEATVLPRSRALRPTPSLRSPPQECASRTWIPCPPCGDGPQGPAALLLATARGSRALCACKRRRGALPPRTPISRANPSRLPHPNGTSHSATLIHHATPLPTVAPPCAPDSARLRAPAPRPPDVRAHALTGVALRAPRNSSVSALPGLRPWRSSRSRNAYGVAFAPPDEHLHAPNSSPFLRSVASLRCKAERTCQ
jgi:hypothetical protein